MISILFKMVLIFFAIASTLLAGYSVQNKLRLRNIRLSWRAGTFKGIPLFASVFFGLILALAAFGFMSEDVPRYGIYFTYLWISCMWFISSYLSSKYYITDYGIVKNINEPSQTIPWFQILDYVEKQDGRDFYYIFTYSEINKSLKNGYHQLTMKVPDSKIEAVKKIVSLKLKHRFEQLEIPHIDLKRIQEE